MLITKRAEILLLLALAALPLNGCMMMHGRGMEGHGTDETAPDTGGGHAAPVPGPERGESRPDRTEKPTESRRGHGRKGYWILGAAAMAAMMVLMVL